MADTSQHTLDAMVQAASSRTADDFERLRISAFLLARRVLDECDRWLKLACDPRRRDVSLGQICRLLELATTLGPRAAGMPLGNEPIRPPVQSDASGYLSGEEALKKIYGPPEPGGSSPPLPDASAPAGPNVPPETAVVAPTQSASSPPESANVSAQPGPSATPEVAPPKYGRRDAWASWSRMQGGRVR